MKGREREKKIDKERRAEKKREIERKKKTTRRGINKEIEKHELTVEKVRKSS